MRWQLKAAVQKSLDFLPEASAENVNYALQRRVSRSFPTSEPQFLLHFDQAIEHVRNYERFAPPEAPALDQVRAYEFGAGWDLVGPLTMYSQGVNHQVLIDLRRLLRWELVDHVVKLFGSQREQLERRAGRELRPVNGRPIGSVEELRRRYGIEYHAPRDARDTGLPNASFNLITNTYTLEHVPAGQLPPILRECERLLAPGGVMSCSVDLHDHYAYADPRISVYNFLRYSDRTWNAINSKLHHQNRLRAPDYIRLFGDTGMTIANAEITVPPDADERLRQLRIAERFVRAYTREELAGTILFITTIRSRRRDN